MRVVKIGGAALSDAAWLKDLGRSISGGAGKVAVVHGGGPDITGLSERLGIEYAWVNGRRATSPELMDVVSMVLKGRVNGRIVSSLIDAGVDAMGVSGEDGSLIQASLADGGSLGRVGRVNRVRSELLEALAARGIVPVISPVSRGPDGGAVNVNADEVAVAVAVALASPELLFVTDVPGVLSNGGVVREVSGADVRRMIEAGEATGGMALKLESAVQALAQGVPVVRIGPFETLFDGSAGTRIRNEAEVSAWL
jgi:acetylglutamate kinase